MSSRACRSHASRCATSSVIYSRETSNLRQKLQQTALQRYDAPAEIHTPEIHHDVMHIDFNTRNSNLRIGRSREMRVLLGMVIATHRCSAERFLAGGLNIIFKPWSPRLRQQLLQTRAQGAAVVDVDGHLIYRFHFNLHFTLQFLFTRREPLTCESFPPLWGLIAVQRGLCGYSWV